MNPEQDPNPNVGQGVANTAILPDASKTEAPATADVTQPPVSTPPVADKTGPVAQPVAGQTASVEALARTEKSRKAIKEEPKMDYHDLWVIGICAALALFITVSAGGLRFGSLKFDVDLNKNLPNILSTLLVVSIFVERVIEVFVSVWADQEVDQHEQNRDYWQSRQADMKNDVTTLLGELNGTPPPSQDRQTEIMNLLKVKRATIEQAAEAADVEAKALLPFEARTRRISTWIGLAVGIFVSAVGFRFLSQIVSIDSGQAQYPFFIAADVLLTGAVLAGGSKLIHQIFSLYDSFMDTTQGRLANKAVSGK
jgi:hypothetical protein